MFDADARWNETWALAGAGPPAGVLDDLVRRHGEKQRHYHTLTHVADCLGKAAAAREHQEDAHAVDLALWFHDAIYAVRGDGNEERSADLAATALSAHVATATLDRVRELILDTRHAAKPRTPDGRVVVDIDLSILGEPAEVFDAYDDAIRREYAWVPGFVYRRKRAAILREFLERERIFRTDVLPREYEERARANLARAIDALER